MKELKMKLSRLVSLFLLSLMLAFTVVGCKKRPYDVSNINNPAIAHVHDIPEAKPLYPDGFDGTNLTDKTLIPVGPGHSGWTKNSSMFAEDTIYFDYDSSAIKSSEKSNATKVADFLKSNPADAVEVEGHCDERGTEEYNRSLGERRALALREELVRLGIDPNRVDTISYGEDRPADSGHDKAAWAKNRRGEFVLLSPPAP